jgi:hypothetical protein
MGKNVYINFTMDGKENIGFTIFMCSMAPRNEADLRNLESIIRRKEGCETAFIVDWKIVNWRLNKNADDSSRTV